MYSYPKYVVFLERCDSDKFQQLHIKCEGNWHANVIPKSCQIL